MTDLQRQFLQILDRHRGLEQAISVPAMAEQLEISTRLAQDVKKALVEQHGICIGSSCGRTHGWYLVETDIEAALTLGQYTNRVKSLVRLIARTKQASVRQTMNELALEFDQEEVKA